MIKATRSVLIPLAAISLLTSCSGGSGSSNSSDAGGNSEIQAVGSSTYLEVADAAEWKADWSKENTVIYHVIGEPDDMHPCNGNSAMRTFLNNYTQKQVMETDLIELKGERPGIVKGHPQISENELEFTYELRDEPTWDNGELLSFEDILFTFKANKCPLTNNPHAKPYLENLGEMVQDEENPRRFTMKMKKKYIQNVLFLTDYPVLQESHFDPNKTLRKYTFAQFDDPKFDTDSKTDLNAWATTFNDPKK
jgi:ABC-type transport system substrate-binding protein